MLLRRLTIYGVVRRSGRYSIPPDRELTLAGLLLMAGGTQDRVVDVALQRYVNGELTTVYQKTISTLGDLDELDVTLDPDDRVLVSTAFTEPAREERVVGEVYLDASVGRAGVYDMVSGGMKLSELLRTAAVLGDLPMDVRVERRVENETVVVFQRTINTVDDVWADDYDILPNDHVFVEQR